MHCVHDVYIHKYDRSLFFDTYRNDHVSDMNLLYLCLIRLNHYSGGGGGAGGGGDAAEEEEEKAEEEEMEAPAVDMFGGDGDGGDY